MGEDQPDTEELNRLANMGVEKPDVSGPTPARFPDGSPLEQQVYETAFKAAKGIIETDFLSSENKSLRVTGAKKDATIEVQNEEIEDLEYRASHDRLTGIYNRGAFEDIVRKKTGHFNRKSDVGRSHILIFADIDDFKKINDTKGHDEGDEVLKQVAHTLNRHVSNEPNAPVQGVVARFGGEEFALLLENMTVEEAKPIVEHLRLLVNAGRRGVGMCFGVTVYEQGRDLLSKLEEADAALYQAKHSDRKNEIIFHETNGNGTVTPRREEDIR